MPTQNLNPTVNTTPDQGGTLGVSGITNNGHSNTLTEASAIDTGPGGSENNTQQRSARWSSFQAGPSGILSLKLKLDWTVNGAVSADSDPAGGASSSSIQFLIEYSLNNGGSWTQALLRTRNASASGGSFDDDSIDESGSIDIALSPSQDISQVQVRDFMEAHAQATAPTAGFATASASITTNISGIKLEARTQDPHMIIVL
jgi:hypothetical protein